MDSDEEFAEQFEKLKRQGAEIENLKSQLAERQGAEISENPAPARKFPDAAKLYNEVKGLLDRKGVKKIKLADFEDILEKYASESA